MNLPVIVTAMLQAAATGIPEHVCGTNVQAQELAMLIIEHEEQQRGELRCNALLAEAAAQRAKTLVTDPESDERTPNQVVIEAGFRFASYYPPVGNQVQADAPDRATPEDAADYLSSSFHHRDLVLGYGEFFSRQTQIGVGYYESDGQSRYVVFIAEPHSTPKLIIKQEFEAPRVIIDEECGRAWRSSRNAEYRKVCRERWLERRDGGSDETTSEVESRQDPE